MRHVQKWSNHTHDAKTSRAADDASRDTLRAPASPDRIAGNAERDGSSASGTVPNRSHSLMPTCERRTSPSCLQRTLSAGLPSCGPFADLQGPIHTRRTGNDHTESLLNAFPDISGTGKRGTWNVELFTRLENLLNPFFHPRIAHVSARAEFNRQIARPAQIALIPFTSRRMEERFFTR